MTFRISTNDFKDTIGAWVFSLVLEKHYAMDATSLVALNNKIANKLEHVFEIKDIDEPAFITRFKINEEFTVLRFSAEIPGIHGTFSGTYEHDLDTEKWIQLEPEEF